MGSILSSLPSPHEFFPPTPAGYSFLYNSFKYFGFAGVITTFFPWIQAMGRTSASSKPTLTNFPGRYAWAIAESLGPIFLTYIIYTLPRYLQPPSNSSTSILGTGLPFWNEILALFYLIHYLNRAIVMPLFLAPSMSPISLLIVFGMVVFQFLNSGSVASWLVYSSLQPATNSIGNPISALVGSPLSVLGAAMFVIGLTSNHLAESQLFTLRRAAAKRKARSEGRAVVTYDKVYVIPPAEAGSWYRYMLFPHYLAEWFEWTGYWLVGIGAGLHRTGNAADGSAGSLWLTPAFWFLANEVLTMLPRTRQGREWYVDKFGKRAVGARGGVSPWAWL